MDRNSSGLSGVDTVSVALRKESVDRNGNLNNTSNCRLAAHQKGGEDRATPHNSRLAA